MITGHLMGTPPMHLLATEATEAGEAVVNAVLAADGVVALVWLIPLVPLLGFVVTLALGERARERVAIAASTFSFVMAVLVFVAVQAQPDSYVTTIAPYVDVGGFTVEWGFLVDQLTAVMLLVVTGVGLLVHIYSIGYMRGDAHSTRFFAYLNLFLAAMLVLITASSLLILFIGWEGVGLASYLLIGFWFEDFKNSSAGTKAFVTNRVGDVAFMIAMMFAFSQFATLDFVTLSGTGILEQPDVLTAGGALALGLLLLLAASAKSAQIPLFVWLPDAMAGPTPVSALMHAATMVTAGVYLMVRTSPILVQSLDAMTIVAWIGAITALVAALIAIRQDGIKKILAYSTVSQLGYMFIGVGTGGFAEGIFHLVTHAFFKGLLFLAAGSVMHALANTESIWRMGGLRKIMPITFWTSAVAWLAISGIPPFAGFFSKDQILTTAYEHGFTGIWVVGVITAVLTAFYMTRWFLLVFMGEARFKEGATVLDPHHGETQLHPHESPSTMTTPLIVLAVLSAVGGLVLNAVHHGPFYNWLQPVTGSVEGLAFAEPGALTEPALIGISIVAAVVGIAIGWGLYGPQRDLSTGSLAEPLRGPVAELMERKFFVDEAYSAIFVGAGGWIANTAAWFDRTVIDGVVNGMAGASVGIGQVTRRSQTGRTRSYLGVVVGSVVVLAAVLIVQVR